jgi:hypothetical protein
MGTSGITTFNPVRDQVIKRALRIVGAYSSTDNPRPEQINDALETLNMWLKTFQMDDVLWLKQFCTLFLNKGQTSYNLAPSTVTGFSHCATSYVQTNLTSAALLGDNHVHIDSASGITNADYIGIANDSGIIEWFYASISGTTATLYTNVGLSIAGALTTACAAGNVVYSHTVLSQIKRPTRIFTAARKYYNVVAANGSEIPLTTPMSRSDYVNLPNKTITGKIIQVFYDPQLVSGVLYVWPTADYAGDKLILTVDRPIQDMVDDSDTYDLPVEGLNALSYGLAVEIAPEYGIPLAERDRLQAKYQMEKMKWDNYNRENVSTFFEIEMR